LRKESIANERQNGKSSIIFNAVSNISRASFPPAFRSMFEPFPAAMKRLTNAHYVERNGQSDAFSWTTGTPKMIPIRECLARQVPTSDFLWDEITQNIDAKQRVEVAVNMGDGTQTIKEFEWSKVVSTLLKEIGRSAESRPEFSAIFGLPLTAEDVQLALPERFGRTISTPDLAKQHTANIGFANQVVNFHVDTGYAGLSALAGDCEKMWLLAPPREANLELLAGESPTLPELVANLSKLVVCRQTSSEVMFLPPGVIHATFTVKTGILYGNNFRTQQNVFGATMGLVHVMREPDEADAWTERDRIIKTWIEVMREIAEHGNEKNRGEALFSFRSGPMRELRRHGAFQHWQVEIEQLAEECYPKARLRERKHEGS
jgi:hypothetical protein